MNVLVWMSFQSAETRGDSRASEVLLRVAVRRPLATNHPCCWSPRQPVLGHVCLGLWQGRARLMWQGESCSSEAVGAATQQNPNG